MDIELPANDLLLNLEALLLEDGQCILSWKPRWTSIDERYFQEYKGIPGILARNGDTRWYIAARQARLASLAEAPVRGHQI